MKIYSKILLITFPLIIIPAVIVSLVSFRVSQAAVQSIAQKTLNYPLTKAIDICTEQANSLREKGSTNSTQVSEAQAAAADALAAVSFGNTGYILVVDADGIVISNPVQHTIRVNISSEAWFEDIHGKDKGSFTYTWEGKSRIAQFQRFSDWGWYLVSSETESELLGPMDMLGFYISGLLAISLIVAFLAILVMARRLTNPIKALLAGTERIQKGELPVHIGVTTNDEIGTLANAFNSMTDQLQEVIGGLEQRVSERTQDLEQRAIQMQTGSEIAREAVSTHELDSLLIRSVNLIQERFNFYHVSIYSLDEQRQYAVLRAGSGETGKIMVQRGFRVRVGDVGFVSHVAGTGEPRVINDVKTDFTYVKHPLLPDTACAAALPLKVGNRIIGILNVENNRANTFNHDNISVLRTLADQLAVAIENARLLEELRNSLKESRSLYKNYTRETWSRATRGRKIPGYQFDLSQINSFNTDLPDEIRTRLLEGHVIPLQGRQSGQSEAIPSTNQTIPGDGSVLLAPLIMYNQLIGVLGVENNDPEHAWSSEEIALIEAVSNQVSLTLDNARLVEETQLRSEQIRLLQEITAAAASHIKLNELLEVVIQRLLTGFNLYKCSVALLDHDGKGEAAQGRQPLPADHSEVPGSTVIAFTSAPGVTSPNLVGTRLPVEKGELSQRALRTHKALVAYGAPGSDGNQNTQGASGQTMPVDNPLISEAARPTVLMVPLLSRGEPLGTIIMEVANPDRQFDEDALRLLEQIGLQVSAAIEVARNFEQTANRAEYERLIGEMTTRIRETLNVETMVKTAAKEVQQALGLPEVVIRLGLPSTRTSNPGIIQPEQSRTLTGENE